MQNLPHRRFRPRKVARNLSWQDKAIWSRRHRLLEPFVPCCLQEFHFAGTRDTRKDDSQREEFDRQQARILDSPVSIESVACFPATNHYAIRSYRFQKTHGRLVVNFCIFQTSIREIITFYRTRLVIIIQSNLN